MIISFCKLNNFSQGQETYTPRLVVVDSKGSLGSLSYLGSLYNDAEDPHTNCGFPSNEGYSLQSYDRAPITVVEQLSHVKNEFLRELDEEEKRYLASRNGEFLLTIYNACPLV